MTFPTLHLNGTSAQDLLDGYDRASAALTEAMEALARTAPNGRDYYVQAPGAWQAAVAEHEARMQRLAEVRGELAALGEHLAEEDLRRRSRRA